jgi:hypothetical protein
VKPQKSALRLSGALQIVLWLNLDKQEIEESDVVAVLESTRSKYGTHVDKYLRDLKRPVGIVPSAVLSQQR